MEHEAIVKFLGYFVMSGVGFLAWITAISIFIDLDKTKDED